MEKAKEQKQPVKKARIIIFFLIILIPAIWFLFINKGSDLDQAAEKLPGSWLRTDGPYSLVISKVLEHGKMTASYFNPNPIHVESADWEMNSGRLKVRIGLKDVNYQGSNYTLTYDKKTDQLVGQYHQAGTGQTYDITFKRK